jgi:hypothetical protein
MNPKTGFITGLLGLCALIGALVIVSTRSGIGQANSSGKTPYQIQALFRGGKSETIQVPEGRYLVLEYAEAPHSCTIETTAGGIKIFWSVGSDGPIKIYADPGSTVTLIGQEGTGGITLSGYLTDRL